MTSILSVQSAPLTAERVFDVNTPAGKGKEVEKQEIGAKVFPEPESKVL